jgi:hypothetical protein
MDVSFKNMYILGYKRLYLQGSAKVRQYWVKLHAGGLQKKSVQGEAESEATHSTEYGS